MSDISINMEGIKITYMYINITQCINTLCHFEIFIEWLYVDKLQTILFSTGAGLRKKSHIAIYCSTIATFMFLLIILG